jgi:hypothetical protein
MWIYSNEKSIESLNIEIYSHANFDTIPRYKMNIDSNP